MSKDNFAVGVVNYACPICGKTSQTDVIMNTRLTKKAAQEVREANGKVVGYSDTACEECASHKDEVVYVIEIDEEKSEPDNFYRTGNILGIKKDFPLFINHPEFILETDNGVKYCYMSNKVTKEIGFYDKEKHGI